MNVVLVDTSILVELLRVPGKSSEAGHREARDGLLARTKRGSRLFLSAPVVIEAGNHVAQADDGSARRRCAEQLRKLALDALEGAGPFSWASDGDDATVWKTVLAGFPDRAMAEISFGDAVLIELVERLRARHAAAHVSIWTLDQQLAAHGDPFES